MSHAVAAEFDKPILFTGGDFARTDLIVHPASRLH
jgi:uncharacterized protein with PIN domain